MTVLIELADKVSGALRLPDLVAEIHVVSLPMVTRFRGITRREAMLVRGPAGWAEFSPFVEYPPEEACRWLAAALESALLPFPEPRRSAVDVNGTIPACPPGQVRAILDRFGGVRTAKIKVAESGISSLPVDIERVRTVMDCDPGLTIRLDANGGWTADEALCACERLIAVPGLAERLEYIEQPTAGVEDLAEVRKRLGGQVRIAADESIRRAEDPMRVAELEAADHIIVKAQPLGGIRQALRIVAQTGLGATVSSALDTSVGLAAGAALAAAMPGRGCAAGLGTGSFFASDINARPLRPHRGQIKVGRQEPDSQALSRLSASPDRQRWWMDRAQECLLVLRQQIEASAG